jgi:hypothetical protein
LKDCGVEKKNLLKILWKTRGKSNGKNFSKIRMLKLLKQKIGFSWKTGWERFPTPRKISEISAISVFPQIVENAVESLRKVCGKPQKWLEIGTFFSLKSAHFSRKNGLYRHNPAAYCGICSRFSKPEIGNLFA